MCEYENKKIPQRQFCKDSVCEAMIFRYTKEKKIKEVEKVCFHTNLKRDGSSEEKYFDLPI